MRFLALLAFLSVCALPVCVLPADAQSGDFNVEDEALLCTSCHGEEGVPTETNIPIIQGQEYFYIVTQLRDFAAGRRQNDVMTPIASNYNRNQAKAIAQYFADRSWPAVPADTHEGDEALAETAISKGQCSACHDKWQGDSRIPRLAGQQAAYLEKTMKDFKNEVRNNAPDKTSTMRQLDDQTIEALSRYLADLQLQGSH